MDFPLEAIYVHVFFPVQTIFFLSYIFFNSDLYLFLKTKNQRFISDQPSKALHHRKIILWIAGVWGLLNGLLKYIYL